MRTESSLESCLEIRGGRYGYDPDSPFASDLNFRLERGEIMAVLGPNGCGKTTLINTIVGMRPWLAGQTLIHGRPLTDYSSRNLWQQIGYVPQARTNAFAYTVMDMVLLGRSAHLGTFNRPGKADRAAARRIMQRLEIRHLEDRLCNSISGGELQLVFIARALMGDPAILFLDEPESHLDFKKQLIILNIIERLASEDGIICMLNTHFPNHALRIAGQVLLIKPGGDHCVGPVAEVLTENTVRDCFEVDTVFYQFNAYGQSHRALFPVSLSSPHVLGHRSQ